MNPYAIHAADLDSLKSEMGDDCPSFTWNGATWTILPGSVTNNKPLRAGGFSNMVDLTFTTSINQFVGKDAATLKNTMLNTTFQYLGEPYKFQRITILSGATILKCEANSLNQNA